MRQQSRRVAFQYAFSQMPYFETWIKREADHTAGDPRKWKPEYDFKTIPRRKRRDMARKLAKRK